MISTEEKQKYLLEKWGFVEIERALIAAPIFDGSPFLRYEKQPTGSYCCRNYSLVYDKVDKTYNKMDGNGNPFWDEVKEFYGLSIKEAIDLAYKSERIGKQLNLFMEV